MERTRKVLHFMLDLNLDGADWLLRFSVVQDRIRRLRVLLGLPPLFATLHGHKILMQKGRMGRFMMKLRFGASCPRRDGPPNIGCPSARCLKAAFVRRFAFWLHHVVARKL